MSFEMRDPVLIRAIEWHVRLRDGDDATWEAFAEWLAADPHHAEAYDRIERLDSVIDPLLPAIRVRAPANAVEQVQPSRRHLGWWIGGALAASAVAGLLSLPDLGSHRYEVGTAVGEQRTISIDAGTGISLNGDTKMMLDRKDPRFAALLYGQALFRVRHDAARPFVLEVGGDRVVDLGTVFDVARDRDGVRVAVGEGRVEYQGAGKPVPLDAGQALVARNGRSQVSSTPRDGVGGWRRKRFLYSDQTLSEVATDLGRALGVSINVAPSIAQRPFSGNLRIDSTSAEDLRRLGIALDVKLVPRAGGWVMRPTDGAHD